MNFKMCFFSGDKSAINHLEVKTSIQVPSGIFWMGKNYKFVSHNRFSKAVNGEKENSQKYGRKRTDVKHSVVNIVPIPYRRSYSRSVFFESRIAQPSLQLGPIIYCEINRTTHNIEKYHA